MDLIAVKWFFKITPSEAAEKLKTMTSEEIGRCVVEYWKYFEGRFKDDRKCSD